MIDPTPNKKPAAKRGDSIQREANDAAGRRAMRNVRLCFTDRMVTLTYRENMVDRELALKHWKAFCRKLGKHKQFHYVAVIEEQARGALHFHMAVAGRQMYALLRSIWQSILGRGPNGEQMGQVHVRGPHRFGFGVAGAHKIASLSQSTAARKCSAGRLNRNATSALEALWCRKSMFGGYLTAPRCYVLYKQLFWR